MGLSRTNSVLIYFLSQEWRRLLVCIFISIHIAVCWSFIIWYEMYLLRWFPYIYECGRAVECTARMMKCTNKYEWQIVWVNYWNIKKYTCKIDINYFFVLLSSIVAGYATFPDSWVQCVWWLTFSEFTNSKIPVRIIFCAKNFYGWQNRVHRKIFRFVSSLGIQNWCYLSNRLVCYYVQFSHA